MTAYSKLDMILHRHFLGENVLTDLFFNRLINSETINNDYKNMKHIFVLGLARSGTTSLLNRIYSSEKIGSILYKHMPFILSPTLANISAKLFTNNSEKVERSHGDNIFISSQSPECLDEVYWIKSNSNFYKSKYLKCPKISTKKLDGYANLLYKFAKNQNLKRLVIKNNNNHIRLKYLSKHFTKASFLILFREPLAHAISLREQHLKFCSMQSKDPFVAEYMNLIGHYEFGLNKKPFIYKNDKDEWFKSNDKKINYWIKQWLETYSYLASLISKKEHNIFLISYENLCSDKKIFNKIEKFININCPHDKNYFKVGKSNLTSTSESYSDSLLKKAQELYSKLSDLSIK